MNSIEQGFLPLSRSIPIGMVRRDGGEWRLPQSSTYSNRPTRIAATALLAIQKNFTPQTTFRRALNIFAVDCCHSRPFEFVCSYVNKDVHVFAKFLPTIQWDTAMQFHEFSKPKIFQILFFCFVATTQSLYFSRYRIPTSLL